MDTAADHAVDVHVKLGVLGQEFQLLIQDLQTLLRDVVRHYVVDRDLQMLQTRPIQSPNAICHQQISVSDHARDHAALADARDDLVQLGMHERLAAADRNDSGAERRQMVEPLVHGLQRNRLRKVIVLIAVGTRKVAAAHRNHMRQNGMVRGGQPFRDHLEFARAPLGGQKCATYLFMLEHTGKSLDYIIFRHF